jgi:hypothetical protein
VYVTGSFQGTLSVDGTVHTGAGQSASRSTAPGTPSSR